MSFLLGALGIVVTVAIFLHQESSSETLQGQIDAATEAIEEISSRVTSPSIAVTDELIEVVDCEHNSLGCLKPQRLGFPKGIDDLFEFESPQNLFTYYRPGFEYLILEKVVSHVQDYELFVIPDRIAKNERPKNLLRWSPTILSVAEYIRFADGKVPGILLAGLSGAGGKELFLALFAPTKYGYRNLFGDEWLSVNHTRFLFEDVDGDGVHDLIAETIYCELNMLSLKRTDTGLQYESLGLSSDEVLDILDKSIVGSELAIAFRMWREYGCPRTTEDGGALWTDIDESISAHRTRYSVLSREVLLRRGEITFPVYREEIPSALIVQDLEQLPFGSVPDISRTTRTSPGAEGE